MSDFLVDLGQNQAAKTVIKSLGLPIPMPPVLERSKDATKLRVLDGRDVAFQSFGDSKLCGVIAKTLAEAGAKTHCTQALLENGAVLQPNEAYGQVCQLLELESNEKPQKFHGVVFDVSEFSSLDDLSQLYAFFNPLMKRFRTCGRAVLISRRPSEAETAEQAAVAQAIDGFVRSLAKELGRVGATAQWIQVAKGGDENLVGPLRFVLSPRSAYVSGQPIVVSGQAKALAKAPDHELPLEGKVALLTGAARGIGAATVRLLAKEGATVICVDRPEDDRLTSTLAREVGGDVCLVDVTSENASEVICNHIRERHQGVDIVIHNAGITRDKTLGRMPEALWEQVLAVNLKAVSDITEALKKDLLRDEARVICLSSIAGISGNPGQTNYAASKAGVIGLIRFWAEELKDKGITVNAIAPGFIETRLTDAMPVPVREVGRRLNNLKQGGQPEDVASAICFLATPGAQGVTGQVLRVCGGSLVGA